jgi:hypothetical protein
MKIRVCNQCGMNNAENAWNCINCGNTLPIAAIIEVQDTSSTTSEKVELEGKPKLESEQRNLGPQKVDLTSELHRLKHEQERQKELEYRAKLQSEQLKEVLSQQRLMLVNQWTSTITEFLRETAKATWGDEKYTLIEPDSVNSFTWTVVRVEGRKKLNYQITMLTTTQSDTGEIQNKSRDSVVVTGFVVVGNQRIECEANAEAIKQTLLNVFKTGPRDGGLETHAESRLRQIPYLEGEYDNPDWKLIVFPIVTILVGLSFLGSNSAEGLLMGLILIGLAITGLSVTQIGKRFNRLTLGQKAIAVIAAIPGICAGGFVILGIIALILWLGREARVSEIEEGVRRGLDK